MNDAEKLALAIVRARATDVPESIETDYRALYLEMVEERNSFIRALDVALDQRNAARTALQGFLDVLSDGPANCSYAMYEEKRDAALAVIEPSPYQQASDAAARRIYEKSVKVHTFDATKAHAEITAEIERRNALAAGKEEQQP